MSRRFSTGTQSLTPEGTAATISKGCPKSLRRTNPRPAFTLLEVLVVVGIIALLVAILVPSLTRARRQARTVVCSAQLHQLGVATESYMVENACYPPHKWRTPTGENERWPAAVAAYIRSEEVQVCPDVPDWSVGRNNSYGYNYKYLGSLRFNDQSRTAPYEMFPVKAVKSPSRTIGYADSEGTGWTKRYQPDGADVEAVGNHGYTLDPTFVQPFAKFTINNEDEQEEFAYLEHRSYISIRHRNGSNAVFLDGHAEHITPGQVYRDNRFWNGLGAEDPVRDPHVSYRVGTGSFRYEAEIQ